ncbi:MAG: hypothetical protein US70_C0003G0005 [Parcubacteria group bacterium GW2011_GWD2_38_11]|nr:MAG: hypothetical protein US70_C0003G0005 [Parcubacteria group bacterium GW2011_GWD2_38_11]
MDNKKILLVLIVVALVIGGGFILKRKNMTQSKSSATVQTGKAGNIKLSADPSGAYNPKEIRVKAGTKVKIEGDQETLTGGMNTVIIDGYNIQKVIAPGDNVIEFVADKKGTFKMYCANGMGNGKLIVE